MPDLRQLRVLIEVGDRLSFTRAAEHLHLQQQTVSKTISQLEAELGVELVQRTTREVRLTPAGAALARSGAGVLAAADAAFAQARRIGTGSLGRIRLGLSPAIAALDRDEVIAAVREPGSDVSVALYDVRRDEAVERLRDRELDVALVRSLGADREGVHHAELRPTPAVICLPEEHPLAQHATLAMRDLDGQRLLVASAPGTPFTDLVLAQFAGAGVAITPVESHVTGGASILGELVPTRSIGLRAQSTELPPGIIAVPIPELRLPLILLWPAGLPSPAVHRLRRVMAGS